jgi:PTH1 family peptidyl-tRNA hydrolase
MYLIVGLGNPENEYAHTRHNMGFDTINQIAKNNNIQITKNKFKGLCESTIIQNQKVILLKPQTYMNLSGESVKEVAEFYNLKPEEIIVIYDDIDIEKGHIKIRKKGGAGSHNGMKSVVEELQSTDFARIRVGIGQPEFKSDMINYVIGKVSQEEQEILQQGVEKAAKAVEEILKNGIDIAMNKFN